MASQEIHALVVSIPDVIPGIAWLSLIVRRRLPTDASYIVTEGPIRIRRFVLPPLAVDVLFRRAR